MPHLPRLYDEFAEWWHLLSRVEDYEDEAALYTRVLLERATMPLSTVLELGSGGGNNAWYMKRRFTLTLTDLSPRMLEQSRRLNPECEHLQGDMRRLRLGRTFDAVFVHDAVAYITTRHDLSDAMETAALHCRPGGLALFAPDMVRETFQPYTDHGGYDGAGKGIRYLEWCRDPDPGDSEVTIDFAYMFRESDGNIHVAQDRHVNGLFSRADWLELLDDAGFAAERIPVAAGILGNFEQDLFVGTRR